MAIEENVTITETAPDGTETDFEITTAKADDLSGDDKTFAEGAVEALFDDGSTDEEASYLDYDGDGKLDTAGADTDGDGQIDTAAADTDGDGKIDAVGKDTDGDGNLDVAVFDTDGDGQADAAMADTDGDGEMDAVDIDGDGAVDYTIEASEGLPTEEEISTNSVEFTVGEDGFPVTDVPEADAPVDFAETPAFDTSVVDTPAESGYSAAPDTSAMEADAAAAAESAEQQANVDAAKEAQSAADEFVAQGDYAAAAEAREVAENAAYEAGDSSMLGASDSSDLENAAYKQEVAQDYREQQAENIAAGDYAAAKEDAQNVAYQTGDADYLASGSDHTGQADSDAQNLDWAVYDEKNADYNAQNAAAYAAEGDVDNAQIYAERAEGYQATADEYADRGDPSSVYNDHDPSSDVMTGGSYDAGSYDASIASVDTGIDTSVDTSAASSYDTTTDDTV